MKRKENKKGPVSVSMDKQLVEILDNYLAYLKNNDGLELSRSEAICWMINKSLKADGVNIEID